MQIDRSFIVSGVKLHMLSVGELVSNVRDHILYPDTKPAYIRHGRLRECLCDCGQSVLYSESALSSGKIKSCGCLRAELRKKSKDDKVKRDEIKLLKINIKHKIALAQHRLAKWKTQPITYRDAPDGCKEMTDLSAELRQLYGQLGHATAKLNANVREQS